MSYGSEERKPLLNFSETQERASLFKTKFSDDDQDEDQDDVDNKDDESMPSRKRKGGKRKKGGINRKGFRLKKGRIGIRVAGYKGLQSVTASDLVRYVPLSKLKVAAKKFLNVTGRGKRGGGGGGKRKKGRKGRKKKGGRKRKRKSK